MRLPWANSRLALRWSAVSLYNIYKFACKKQAPKVKFDEPMTNHPLTAHIPRWVASQLAVDALPLGEAHTCHAAVLYADLVGFTPLTESLARSGAEGIESLSQVLNTIFGALVETVYAYGGDIAKFSGDALLAWWPLAETESGLQAVTAAQVMQTVMHRFDRVATPAGPMSLTLRIGVGRGPLTAMVVGNAAQQYFLCSGPAVEAATAAEKCAPHGQVILHSSIRQGLDAAIQCDASGQLLELRTPAPAISLDPFPTVSLTRLAPFVHPTLVERLQTGQEKFLADFRYDVSPMFVAFSAADLAVLQTFVVQATAIIQQHGGYLLEVEVGDKGNLLVITFGAPLSSGDNPRRAAACALDLAALPGVLGIGATLGAVVTGVVGNARRCQYTIWGDEMNLAARLMQVAITTLVTAERAPILISTRVSYALRSEDRFVCGPRQVLALKGKSAPVPVVSLLGLVQYGGDWLRPWFSANPVIGRRTELVQLEAHIAAAAAGAGCILTLVGEAGMGKSCLAGELLRRWLAHGGEAYVGAASVSAQHSPYSAWSELLRAFFDLHGDEHDLVCIKEALAFEPELEQRLPLLSDVLGLGLPDNDLTRHFDARLRQQSMHALLVELVRVRSRQRPLLLLLEDVHWLDQPSWEMALSIARAITNLPVLLCLVHRPLAEPLPALYSALAGLEHHASLILSELAPHEAVDLACARLGAPALPGELAELIQSKAQGNPFFIEEIINALRDSEAIRVEEDQIVVRRDLARIEWPDTVQGVVQARLDQLNESTRLTIKVASIIGRVFVYPVLIAIHPARPSAADLREQLELSSRLDITLLEHPEPELTYIFKHSITHDVAYQTMTFAQRRELHQAAAEWYEAEMEKTGSIGDGTATLSRLSLLVHHCHYAGDARREQHYARLAGESAAAQFANADAVTYLSRALELTPEDDLAERYAILLAREKVSDLQGQRQLQADDIAALSQLADALGADRLRAEAALRRARCAEIAGDYQSAAAAVQSAIALARAAGDTHFEALGYQQWGQALWRTGDYQGARSRLEQALEVARGVALPAVEAESLRTLGNMAAQQSDYEAARAYYMQSLRICQAVGDRRGEANVLNNLGLVAQFQSDLAESQKYNSQALELYRSIGDRQGESLSLINLASRLVAQGDAEQARVCQLQALRLSRDLGFRENEARALDNLGGLCSEQGDHVQAQQYLEQALTIQREIGNRSSQGFTQNRLGNTLIHLGQYALAQDCLESALHISREKNIRRLEQIALRRLGRIARRQGDYARASDYAEQSLRFSRELHEQLNESLQLAELGLIAHQQGHDQAAQTYSQEALEIACKCGVAGKNAQGWALTVLGHALFRLDRLAEAADAYQRALDIWCKPEHIGPALEARAGLARIAFMHGDLDQARFEVQDILDYLSQADNTLSGVDEPFWLYLSCYQVLNALGDFRAREILTRAYHLLQEHASNITDDVLRRSFLENVAVHRELAALWTAQNNPNGNQQIG